MIRFLMFLVFIECIFSQAQPPAASLEDLIASVFTEDTNDTPLESSEGWYL